jgi:hypothetical protein
LAAVGVCKNKQNLSLLSVESPFGVTEVIDQYMRDQIHSNAGKKEGQDVERDRNF